MWGPVRCARTTGRKLVLLQARGGCAVAAIQSVDNQDKDDGRHIARSEVAQSDPTSCHYSTGSSCSAWSSAAGSVVAVHFGGLGSFGLAGFSHAVLFVWMLWK